MWNRVAVGRDSCGSRAAPAGLAAGGRQFGLGLVLLRLDLLGVATASVMRIRLRLGDTKREIPISFLFQSIPIFYAQCGAVIAEFRLDRRLQHPLLVRSNSTLYGFTCDAKML